jgi:mRNA interferase HicA
MNSKEFIKWLAARGTTFENYRGGSGHVTALRGDRRSVIPVHGARKELGKGLVEKIKKDLGLK